MDRCSRTERRLQICVFTLSLFAQQYNTCRRVPFVREPLWNMAAVASHQDILEASHCASLTAGLRQLAGVVQHAAASFENLHGQVLCSVLHLQLINA